FRMNATRNRTFRQLPAVTGTVKVLRPVGSIGPEKNQVGEITINGKPYFVRLTDTCYQLFGFDEKKGEPSHYDVAGDSCDCPDATYRDRPGGCKHCRAIAALINAGKLPRFACAPVSHVDDLADVDALLDDSEADAWHSHYDAA